MQNYNPAHADLALLQDLFSRYGADFIRGRELDPALRDSLGISALPHSREPHEDELDDFAAAGIESAEDIRKRWVDSFYFGSEADDRTVAAAFNDRVHPLGAKINAIWSSDIGHWDVPDLTEPLAESWDRSNRASSASRTSRPWCSAIPTASTPRPIPISSGARRSSASSPPARRHRHQDPRRLTPRPV